MHCMFFINPIYVFKEILPKYPTKKVGRLVYSNERTEPFSEISNIRSWTVESEAFESWNLLE